MPEDVSQGEIARRLVRVEAEKVNKETYEQRQEFVDREFADIDEWQEKHEENHSWLMRLIASTALGLIVKFLIDFLNSSGGSVGP